MPPPSSQLRTRIASRIAAKAPFGVWTPADFLDLGERHAVDKVLQRLVHAGELRRIERGLYDRPGTNSLTGAPTPPDYRRVIEALARRDKTRMLIDGMTAANDLGLTDAVPARVVIHTDARRSSIRIDDLTIEFKKTVPSRLYWAGRPAMRVVQALRWLKDMLPNDRERIVSRLRALIASSPHGPAIRADLEEGFPTLPGWMQSVVRELLDGGRQAANPRGLAKDKVPVLRARSRAGESRSPLLTLTEPVLPLPPSALTRDDWARIYGEEFADWMRLAPAERWRESRRLWATFYALGGRLHDDLRLDVMAVMRGVRGSAILGDQSRAPGGGGPRASR